MKDLKIHLVIIVLTEDTTIPAGWDGNSSEWLWRKISIVPSFATYENGEYAWIDGLSINGFNPEKFHKNIGEIQTSDIRKEVDKIKEKIEKQYSGEIQILWR